LENSGFFISGSSREAELYGILENRKLVSHDPEIIEDEKMTVLEIPNFTRFLMKASGYTLLLQTFDETIFNQNGGNPKNEENPYSLSTSENANIEKPSIYAGETNFSIPSLSPGYIFLSIITERKVFPDKRFESDFSAVHACH